MTTFLEDSNLLEIFDGSAYKQVSGLTGGVLQVVSATTSTQVSTSSTSYQDSGLTATITPRRATSRILILTHQTHNSQRADTQEIEIETQLVRTSTSLSIQRVGYLDTGQNTYRGFYGVTAFNWVDSPNTTSATTYKIQHRSVSGNGITAQVNSWSSHITLLELAG
jgi:hypothetical protein